MKCTILHEGKGRMRVHVEKVRITLHRADVLEAYLNHKDAIIHAAVYERTGDVVITYTGKRTAAIAVLAGYKFDVAEYDALVTSADSRRLNREYQDKMFDLVAGRCLRKLFLPAPLDAAYTAFRSIRFLWKGVRCVLSRRLEVEVLDALSIGVSLLRGDFGTAGSVMFLLNLGSLLEEWTRKKSLDDLARSMALNVDKVWVRSQGTEVLVPLTKVRSGDEVVVRSGNMIPLDGTVLEGEAMVNQAALTGEAMPVRKAEGSTLYAGTVVEEGECVFIAKAEGGSNRYDKIVAMIEESEKLKSNTENRALVLADKLVPWCLGATVVTLSAHPQRHPRHLLPDGGFLPARSSSPCRWPCFPPCAECGSYHITVKGGKYLEALSQADPIVFRQDRPPPPRPPQGGGLPPLPAASTAPFSGPPPCWEAPPPPPPPAAVRPPRERGLSLGGAPRGGVHLAPRHPSPRGGGRARSPAPPPPLFKGKSTPPPRRAAEVRCPQARVFAPVHGSQRAAGGRHLHLRPAAPGSCGCAERSACAGHPEHRHDDRRQRAYRCRHCKAGGRGPLLCRGAARGQGKLRPAGQGRGPHRGDDRRRHQRLPRPVRCRHWHRVIHCVVQRIQTVGDLHELCVRVALVHAHADISKDVLHLFKAVVVLGKDGEIGHFGADLAHAVAAQLERLPPQPNTTTRRWGL